MYKGIGTLFYIKFRQEWERIRVIAGYAAGFLCAFLYAYAFRRFAGGEAVQGGEGFVLLMGNYFQMSFVLLGFLVVVSDIPLVDSLTPLVILRSGRKSWILSMLSYLFGQTVLYYGIVFLGTAAVNLGNLQFTNVWSESMEMLLGPAHLFAVEEYGISVFAPQVLSAWMPWMAFLHSFLLICCYSFFLALVMFLGNLDSSHPWGSMAAIGIHFVGVLSIKTGYGVKYSFLANAVLEFHAEGKTIPSVAFSYLLFLLCGACITYLIFVVSKKTDYKCSNGDRMW